MSRVRSFLVAAVPVAAACATLAVSTAPASAGVNVVTAIHQQDLVINASGAVQRLRHLEATSQNNPKKLYKPIEEIARKFSHAASVVSNSSAATARQRDGRHNWVSGVNEIAAGFYRLGRALHDVIHGAKTNTAKIALDAESKINRGRTLLLRADRQLGLKSGD